MLELVEVRGGQAVQAFLAIGCEPDAGETPVVVITPSLYQLCRLGAVHQLDGAVMTQQQIAGEIPDGRALRCWMALDRQQQLVLGRCQAYLTRLSLAPVQEPAQAGPEGQQVLVVLLGQLTHIPTTRVAGLRGMGPDRFVVSIGPPGMVTMTSAGMPAG